MKKFVAIAMLSMAFSGCTEYPALDSILDTGTTDDPVIQEAAVNTPETTASPAEDQTINQMEPEPGFSETTGSAAETPQEESDNQSLIPQVITDPGNSPVLPGEQVSPGISVSAPDPVTRPEQKQSAPELSENENKLPQELNGNGKSDDSPESGMDIFLKNKEHSGKPDSVETDSSAVLGKETTRGLSEKSQVNTQVPDPENNSGKINGKKEFSGLDEGKRTSSGKSEKPDKTASYSDEMKAGSNQNTGQTDRGEDIPAGLGNGKNQNPAQDDRENNSGINGKKESHGTNAVSDETSEKSKKQNNNSNGQAENATGSKASSSSNVIPNTEKDQTTDKSKKQDDNSAGQGENASGLKASHGLDREEETTPEKVNGPQIDKYAGSGETTVFEKVEKSGGKSENHSDDIAAHTLPGQTDKVTGQDKKGEDRLSLKDNNANTPPVTENSSEDGEGEDIPEQVEEDDSIPGNNSQMQGDSENHKKDKPSASNNRNQTSKKNKK